MALMIDKQGAESSDSDSALGSKKIRCTQREKRVAQEQQPCGTIIITVYHLRALVCLRKPKTTQKTSQTRKNVKDFYKLSFQHIITTTDERVPAGLTGSQRV